MKLTRRIKIINRKIGIRLGYRPLSTVIFCVILFTIGFQGVVEEAVSKNFNANFFVSIIMVIVSIHMFLIADSYMNPDKNYLIAIREAKKLIKRGKVKSDECRMLQTEIEKVCLYKNPEELVDMIEEIETSLSKQ